MGYNLKYNISIDTTRGKKDVWITIEIPHYNTQQVIIYNKDEHRIRWCNAFHDKIRRPHSTECGSEDAAVRAIAGFILELIRDKG